MKKSRTEGKVRKIYDTAFRLIRMEIYMGHAPRGLGHVRFAAWDSYSWRRHTQFTGWINKAREWEWSHHPYNEIPF